MDCEVEFFHTVADQTFFYEKGFGDPPKRCKDCRWAKKQRMEGGDDGGKGKGKGKKGKEGKEGKDAFRDAIQDEGEPRAPLLASKVIRRPRMDEQGEDATFDLEDTLKDLDELAWLCKAESRALGREIERRLLGPHFEAFMQVVGPAEDGRQRFQAALNDKFWAFTKAQRMNLLDAMLEMGLELDWKESGGGGGKEGGKGDGGRDDFEKGDGKGKKGKKGKRERFRGRRRGEQRGGWQEEEQDGKTGANTIEVNWKPPGGANGEEGNWEEDGEEPAAKRAKEPSPVRGPAGRGRGSTMPSWMTKADGPAAGALPDAAAPEPQEVSRGPAGRGRGSTLPSWMTKGVSEAPPPSIPDMSEAPEPAKEEPELNLLDSVFDERSAAQAGNSGRRSRSPRRKGKDKGKGKGKGKWWEDNTEDTSGGWQMPAAGGWQMPAGPGGAAEEPASRNDIQPSVPPVQWESWGGDAQQDAQQDSWEANEAQFNLPQASLGQRPVPGKATGMPAVIPPKLLAAPKPAAQWAPQAVVPKGITIPRPTGLPGSQVKGIVVPRPVAPGAGAGAGGGWNGPIMPPVRPGGW